MAMVLNLKDSSKASFRHVNGQAKVTFHALSNLSVLFPKDTQVSIPLVERLYETLKAKPETAPKTVIGYS